MSLRADEGLGYDLQVDSTVAVLPEWPGPVMLGYRGFLERIRLAIDPGGSPHEPQRIFFGTLSLAVPAATPNSAAADTLRQQAIGLLPAPPAGRV
jgi:hypothetical protein